MVEQTLLPGKLRWHCRRGMKELDVMLLRYLDTHYDSSSPAEQRAFTDLLELQDPQLYAYLMGRETPPNETLAHVLGKIAASD